MDIFHMILTLILLFVLVPILVIPAKIFNASVRSIYRSFTKTYQTIRH